MVGRIFRWWRGLHPERDRVARRVFLVALIGFVCLTALTVVAIAYDKMTLRTSVAFEHAMADLPKVFQKKAEALRDVTKELASSTLLQRYVQERNIVDLQAYLIDEYRRRGLGGLAATDENGVVLSRSHAASIRDDNVYLGMVWGQRLARGEQVTSVEQGAVFPLNVIGAVPLLVNGEQIGSLIAIDTFDASYLQSLVRDVFPEGTILVAYTPEDGTIADSFDQKEESSFLRTYFNTGTEKIRDGKSDELFQFNGRTYVLKNHVFPGLEESPGGLLILFPRWFLGRIVTVSVIGMLAMACVLIMLGIARGWFRSGMRAWVALALCSIATGIIVFWTTKTATFLSAVSIKEPGFTIYNSTLELSPSTSVYSLGNDQRLSVRVRSGGESVNAFTVNLRYDTSIVLVKDIVTTASICDSELFAKKSVDPEAGLVSISCGVPSPGFSGDTGIIAEIVFQPLVAGSFSFRFDPASRVLANDGLGTNVLRTAFPGSYQAADFGVTDDLVDAEPPIIVSTTHRNSERWYRAKRVALNWLADPHALFAYEWTRSADDVPSLAQTTEKKNIGFRVDGDGVYWLHVAPVINGQLGATAHRPVRIDATPPRDVSIEKSSGTVRRGELLRLQFRAGDELSGLQPNFYLKVDRGIFFPMLPNVQLTFQKLGKHTLTMRVYDAAGNYRQVSTTVRVKK